MKKSIKRIENLLQKSLNIKILEVIDESALHIGHPPMLDNKYEVTHVCIKIASPDLQELNRVDQHRRLYDILQPELNNGLHSVRFQII